MNNFVTYYLLINLFLLIPKTNLYVLLQLKKLIATNYVISYFESNIPVFETSIDIFLLYNLKVHFYIICTSKYKLNMYYLILHKIYLQFVSHTVNEKINIFIIIKPYFEILPYIYYYYNYYKLILPYHNKNYTRLYYTTYFDMNYVFPNIYTYNLKILSLYICYISTHFSIKITSLYLLVKQRLEIMSITGNLETFYILYTYLCVKLLQIEYLFQHTNVIQISVAVLGGGLLIDELYHGHIWFIVNCLPKIVHVTTICDNTLDLVIVIPSTVYHRYVEIKCYDIFPYRQPAFLKKIECKMTHASGVYIGKRKVIFLKVSSRIDRLNDKAIHIKEFRVGTRRDFEINKNVNMTIRFSCFLCLTNVPHCNVLV
ncbi:hypothetical protein AGLY_014188 [Aphis glycines]|uniref:Uncharacterized protein n=1 Tax=Aphis glycines TaxID=307491 RepID=A0A6G0T4C3_APHGL|nr:hypothetical protein AGLY_014188 [Aphis glycines]